MKILITGAKGLLGQALAQALKNERPVLAGRDELDVTNLEDFKKFASEVKPDVIIHCAAMTDVDACETDKRQAYLVNAVGCGYAAAVSHLVKARLISVSTDYVFDGKQSEPYGEEDAANGGDSVYGRSKFIGEEFIRALNPNHVIIRTAWLYGRGGKNFVDSMLSLSRKELPELKVVSDQRGNPTSAVSVAEKIREILQRPDINGTIHVTSEGSATRYEFAEEIFRLANISQKVVPCSSEQFPRPAPRPNNSCLSKNALRRYGLSPMLDWSSELKEYLTSLKKED